MTIPYISFKYKNKNFINNQLQEYNNKYFDIITRYLHNNLDNILSKIKFFVIKIGLYTYFGPDEKEKIIYINKFILNYLKQYKQQIIGNKNINWNMIIDEYSHIPDFILFRQKIKNYIVNLNKNYNFTLNYKWEKPIIAIRVELNKKIYDKIYIGEIGQSHNGLIYTVIIPELISINAKIVQPITIYQAYLLGTIVFMDSNMPNTYDDLEYVKNLLINDSRITKIYTEPINEIKNIVRVAKINKKKNLGVDIDNCLNNLNNRLLKLVKKYYNVTIDEKYYDIRKELKLTNKEWLEFIENHQKELKVTVENQCQYYLRKLQKIYNIYIITARPYSFADETIQWLKLNKIPYDDIFFQSGNKVDTCKFLNINYMIEDSPWNILALQKNEINCLIYDRPYNQHIKNNDYVERVYNWQNIYKFLIGIKDE